MALVPRYVHVSLEPLKRRANPWMRLIFSIRINNFDDWNYQFELAGHKTTPHADAINRHEQRKKYFFRPLVDLLGGSLAGKRVLDLGCNQGFWSLAAIENGCDYVLGIDGRQTHIDQAKFVFDVKGINKARYNFRCRQYL